MAALIRLAAEADAAAIASIYRPYVLNSRISFEVEPPDARTIAERMASPLHPWLVAQSGDDLIGFASTSAMRGRAAYRWSVETGLYVAQEAQGRGIGRALLGAHLDILERQGFVTAVAGIALPNEPSIALHEKLGFTQAGVERGVGFKLDEWVDVARWQRDLASRQPAPSEPLAFARCGSACPERPSPLP